LTIDAIPAAELGARLLDLRATLEAESIAGYVRGLKAFGNWCAAEEVAAATGFRAAIARPVRTRYPPRVFLGIDHVVIAVADPDEGAAQLERELGLAATGGGRHDALGTFNRLIWLGDSYLELVGVFDRALAASSWLGAPTLRTLDMGGGLATWAIATDELDHDVAGLRGAGSDLGETIAGERRRTDGRIVRWRISMPPQLGPGEPPFLIEHGPTSAEWTRTDRANRAAQRHPIGGTIRIEALELPVDDVNGMIQRLLRTTGLRFRPSLSGGGSRDADIGGQIVRLRPRRGGSGSAVIHLAAPIREPRTAELLGCRLVVRPTTA
jgi:hypothetical protein